MLPRLRRERFNRARPPQRVIQAVVAIRTFQARTVAILTYMLLPRPDCRRRSHFVCADIWSGTGRAMAPVDIGGRHPGGSSRINSRTARLQLVVAAGISGVIHEQRISKNRS